MNSLFKQILPLLVGAGLVFPTALSAQSYMTENIPVLKSILLREAPISYVTRLIGETWGRPIVVNEGARDKEVSLFLDDINCLNALKAVCHSNGLWFQEDPESNIIYVETLEEYVQGSRLNNQKKVEVVTVNYPRAEDLAASLQELFQDMVVYVEPEEENGDQSEDIERAIDRMTQLASLSTLVDESGTGTGSTGFTGGAFSNRTNRNRNTNNGFGEGIEATSRFQDELVEVETRTDQIEADATGQPTRLNPGLVYIAAVRRSNNLLLRSSDPDAIEQIKQVISELDRPTAQVLLEVKVLALDVSDEKQRAIDILYTDPGGNYGGGFAQGIGNFPLFFEDGSQAPGLGNIDILGASLDSRSVVFQVIGEEVQARIKLLDDEGKIERLATPNLMVADLEASRLFIGDETTILTDVNVTSDTTGGDNPILTITRDPVTERRDIGTTLVITPKIHADNTVTIRVMQEDARVGLTKVVSFGDTVNGDFFETTDIQKQTITSTVVAKSGETVALGGLVRSSESSDVQSVPVLSEIPVLGGLFERKIKSEIESELIILIRPFVMLSPSTAESLSQSFINRNVTHPAAHDGSLSLERDNPTREGNMSTRAQFLHDRIEMKGTSLDILDTKPVPDSNLIPDPK